MSTCFTLVPLTFKPLITPKPPLYQLSFYSHSRLFNRNATLIRCSNHDKEESRWLREEQRWLREEQRWLREESRWNAERDSLIQTISALKVQLEELERQEGTDDTSSTSLLPGFSRIAEIGSGSVPLVLEAAKEEEEVVVAREEVVVEKEVKKRGALRSGSEGDDVKELQEALQKLGFYCGEEDEEFSCFSSGTERAVKTWQASLGIPEDGIMTAELQERLYTELQVEYSSVVLKKNRKITVFPKEGINGAAVVSRTEVSEIQKEVVEDQTNTEIDATQSRVFLLGENRWEEPSRLVGKNNADGGDKRKGSTTTCLSCRGVGRLLCSECDGSGEPNIEEQFMEWVDEGMKCPYCEGHGFATCDVCNGTGETVV